MQAGDQVPDCEFTRLDGTKVHLAELGAEPLLLIFLRHLA